MASSRSDVIDWFYASRPMLHLPAWSIFLVALHEHHRLSGGAFGIENLLMLLTLSLTAAASLYFNQAFDQHTDMLNEKLGILPSCDATTRRLQHLFFVLNLAALLTASFISVRSVSIVLQWILIGFLYSAPPYRLKDRPWLGIISNGYGVGFLTVMLVMPVFSMHDIGLLGWGNPEYFFLAVAGVTALTTIPDISGDAVVGKQTVSVVFGPRVAALIAAGCFSGAVYFALRSEYYWLALIATTSVLLAIGSVVVHSAAVYRFCAKFPILMLTFLACFYYPIYLLFIIALLFVTRLYYKRRHGLSYPQLA